MKENNRDLSSLDIYYLFNYVTYLALCSFFSFVCLMVHSKLLNPELYMR